jgi:putative endonuclease
MPYMYILRCTDGSLVTGTTWNLSVQMGADDCPGGTTRTAWRRPVELVYVEPFDRLDEAYYREREVHGWDRSRKIRLIAEGPGRLGQPE